VVICISISFGAGCRPAGGQLAAVHVLYYARLSVHINYRLSETKKPANPEGQAGKVAA
jgi:hypothetical protein